MENEAVRRREAAGKQRGQELSPRPARASSAAQVLAGLCSDLAMLLPGRVTLDEPGALSGLQLPFCTIRDLRSSLYPAIHKYVEIICL